MAEAEDDESEKPHEPTHQKLLDARNKGEVVRSQDLTTAASYGGFLLTGLAIGAGSITTLSETMMPFLAQSNHLSELVFEGHGLAALGGFISTICLSMMGWFVIPAGLALLSVLGQQSLVISGERLLPKLSRINLVENAKKKFGFSGLFEFFKSFVKLVVFSVGLGIYLTIRLNDVVASFFSNPAMISALMMRMLIEFMFVVLAVSIVLGVLDYLWQHYDFMRQHRMSLRELKQEHKSSEGDPHMKQERRRRGHQIASEQMMADVPTSDVVIMNPTHYAIALKWSRKQGAAPVCVAKGADHIALAIRDCARETGVPVRHDPPTARALYAGTIIGHEIDPKYYSAVAAAIRFSETMRRRARSFG